MVVHGECDHAQEKAGCQDQANTSPGTLTATTVGLLGCFHNHVASYGISAIKSSIIKGSRNRFRLLMIIEATYWSGCLFEKRKSFLVFLRRGS
jgi:hypothetical protein